MPRDPRPNDLMVHVGRRLKVIRGYLDVEQLPFANAIGVRANTLSQWETGTRLADAVAMIRMAHRFQLPLDFVYLGSLRGFDFEERERIEALAAKHEACLGAPYPEFPMQREGKPGIAGLRVPGHVPRRRPRGRGTLHEDTIPPR